MNRTNEQKALGEMELEALEKFLDYQGISVSDYVNAEIMGLNNYFNYLELYHQVYGYCFECQEKECDEDCPSQVGKEESDNR